MPTQLQFRRYSSDQIANITGKIGEIFLELNTDNDPHKIRLSDGVTKGAKPLKISYEDIIGNIADNTTLNDKFTTKADQADITSHVDGISFKHAAEDITYSGTGVPPDTTVKSFLETLANSKADVSSVIFKSASTQTITSLSNNNLSLSLRSFDSNRSSTLNIGHQTYAGTSGVVSQLSLFGKSGDSFNLLVESNDISDSSGTLKLIRSYDDETPDAVLLSTNDDNDIIVENNLHVKGDITFGEAGAPIDKITVNADFSGDLIPTNNDEFDLGSTGKKWKELNVNKVNINNYSLPTTTGSAGQAIIANDNGTTSFQDVSTDLTINADNSTPATISLLSDQLIISGGSGVTTSVDAYGEVTIDFDTSDSLNSLTVDNITLDENTISSTGDITIDPDNSVIIDGDLILRDDPLDPLDTGQTRTITLIGERQGDNSIAYAQINLDNFDANYGIEGTQYTGASIKAFLPVYEANGGGHLTFSTANGDTLTEAMRIDHLGNVGIGKTPDTATKLDVNGAAKISTSLTINDYSLPTAYGSPGQAIITDGNGTTSFQDISTTLTVNADNVNPATISLLSDSLIISGAGSVNTSVDAYGEVTVSVDLENVSTDIEITNNANGVILRSPNNSRWKITVDDNGNLTTTLLVP